MNQTTLYTIHTGLVERDECYKRLDKETNWFSTIRDNLGIFLLSFGAGYLAHSR
jgi:hypothetical protein